jgi:pyruvate-ferredoxin/flavodoxin oxidoreductase
LNPGICAQDGFLTSHSIEDAALPERELVRIYLGDPSDMIDAPTPAQRMVFGEQRRRVPELFDVDYPTMLGVVQNQDSYAQGVAAQRPFYFDHVAELTDRAFAEFAALTGRAYARATGYRLEDAEYVLAGQGSLVPNAEVVADYLRKERGLKIGVLNVSMFRPFPSDLITGLLKGKKCVTVLERLDQPLAVDPPLLRELRAAMGKAMENGRANGTVPHEGVARCAASEVPDFFSGCFGMGSRDLQPGDLVAAVDNMVNGGRRQFYLGIEFIRRGTRLPKLQIWQEQILDSYPQLADLALESAGDLDLMPDGALSIRIHSIGGWGAITMGKNLALTAAELLKLHIRANPKYGSEKKGQPTTFYATLASEPIRVNCELKHVDVVLSPDPNVFGHSNPLAGLGDGGVFVIQGDAGPGELWNSLPRAAQREIRERKIRIFFVDAFKIANEEASDPEHSWALSSRPRPCEVSRKTSSSRESARSSTRSSGISESGSSRTTSVSFNAASTRWRSSTSRPSTTPGSRAVRRRRFPRCSTARRCVPASATPVVSGSRSATSTAPARRCSPILSRQSVESRRRRAAYAT